MSSLLRSRPRGLTMARNGRYPLLGCIAWFLLTLGAVGPVGAEQAVTVPPWTVHYFAVQTDRLDAAVARANGITRSASRVMLSLAVFEATAEGRRPVDAFVEASAEGRQGPQPIHMRLLEDAGGRYQVGFVRVADEETLAFAVAVTPAGASRPIVIRFDQQFFVD